MYYWRDYHFKDWSWNKAFFVSWLMVENNKSVQCFLLFFALLKKIVVVTGTQHVEEKWVETKDSLCSITASSRTDGVLFTWPFKSEFFFQLFWGFCFVLFVLLPIVLIQTTLSVMQGDLYSHYNPLRSQSFISRVQSHRVISDQSKPEMITWFPWEQHY